MATIKIAEYAEQEGISVPAVHKRVKAGKIKAVLVNGIKHIEVDSGNKPEFETNDKPASTEVKPINQSKLKKENIQLKEKIKTLEIANARLEEKVAGKDETIIHLKEQQKFVMSAMEDNSKDLKQTIGTFATLEKERIHALSHQKMDADVQQNIQPVKPTGFILSLQHGLIIITILGFILFALLPKSQHFSTYLSGLIGFN